MKRSRAEWGWITEAVMREVASSLTKPDLSPFPEGTSFKFYRAGSDDIYELISPRWTVRMIMGFPAPGSKNEPEWEYEGFDDYRDWSRAKRRI